MNEFLVVQESLPPSEVYEPVPLPGALLAAQRHALGWTIEYVAGQIKLSPRQIISLETDNYAALPGMFIVKGFMRAYAKILKLDAAPLIAMLPQKNLLASSILPNKKELSAPFTESRLRSSDSFDKSSKRLIVVVLLIAVFAGFAVANYMGFLSNLRNWVIWPINTSTRILSSPDSVLPSGLGEAPDPISRKQDEMQNQPTLHARLREPQPLSKANDAIDLSQTTPLTVSGYSAQNKINNDLILLMREDSWLDIRRSNGSVLISRIAKAGVAETISITEPVQLTVGNVHGVEATLRGVPLELKSGKSNTIRLNLK